MDARVELASELKTQASFKLEYLYNSPNYTDGHPTFFRASVLKEEAFKELPEKIGNWELSAKDCYDEEGSSIIAYRWRK